MITTSGSNKIAVNIMIDLGAFLRMSILSHLKGRSVVNPLGVRTVIGTENENERSSTTREPKVLVFPHKLFEIWNLGYLGVMSASSIILFLRSAIVDTSAIYATQIIFSPFAAIVVKSGSNAAPALTESRWRTYRSRVKMSCSPFRVGTAPGTGLGTNLTF